MDAKEAAEKYRYYEEHIKELYAKRADPKYLDLAIQACKEEIEIARYAIPELTKPTFQRELADDDDFMENLLDYADGKDTAATRALDAWSDNTDGDPPGLYKEGGVVKEIPSTLAYHTGYKQLCIIREKEGNYAEVIRLATQAKQEGWYGDWDKRIEKAKKKLAG
jgi:hypothetical protein